MSQKAFSLKEAKAVLGGTSSAELLKVDQVLYEVRIALETPEKLNARRCEESVGHFYQVYVRDLELDIEDCRAIKAKFEAAGWPGVCLNYFGHRLAVSLSFVPVPSWVSKFNIASLEAAKSVYLKD